MEMAWRHFQFMYQPRDTLNSGSELSSFAFRQSIKLFTDRPANIKGNMLSARGQHKRHFNENFKLQQCSYQWRCIDIEWTIFTLASMIAEPVCQLLIKLWIFWQVATHWGMFRSHLSLTCKQDVLFVSPFPDHQFWYAVFASDFTIVVHDFSFCYNLQLQV